MVFAGLGSPALALISSPQERVQRPMSRHTAYILPSNNAGKPPHRFSEMNRHDRSRSGKTQEVGEREPVERTMDLVSRDPSVYRLFGARARLRSEVRLIDRPAIGHAVLNATSICGSTILTRQFINVSSVALTMPSDTSTSRRADL